MSSKNDPEAFYKKLKTQLEETTQFPTLYMYKFSPVYARISYREISNTYT